MNILNVLVSPNSETSFSRKVNDYLLHKITKPGVTVVTRDLGREAVPHLQGRSVQALLAAADARTAEQNELLALSDKLIAELRAADTVIVSTPMWNFGLPSVLKAWIDHIVRSELTFIFQEGRFKGLMTGKRVFVIVASGAVFSEGPYMNFDALTLEIRAAFGFMGMGNIEFIWVEGTNDPRARNTSVAKAVEMIETLKL